MTLEILPTQVPPATETVWTYYNRDLLGPPQKAAMVSSYRFKAVEPDKVEVGIVVPAAMPEAEAEASATATRAVYEHWRWQRTRPRATPFTVPQAPAGELATGAPAPLVYAS